MEENRVVKMFPSSSQLENKLAFHTLKDNQALNKMNVDASLSKSSPPIPGFEHSSKIWKVLDTNEKVIKQKDHNVLLPSINNNNMQVGSFDLNKSILSYEPNVDTASVYRKFDQKNSIAMGRALKIQENLTSQFPSFVKTMLLSQVSGGFKMNLPKNFSDLHMPKHDESTVLLVDESEVQYMTKYLARQSGLSAGWRRFSIAHKLQEKDVLVFHLIQQCKFKVYIVRASASTDDIVGYTGFQNLGACVGEMDKDHKEKDVKNTEMAPEKYLEPYPHGNSVQGKEMVPFSNDVGAAADHFEMDTDNNWCEKFEVIRFSQSVVDFKDVKCFENFNILVNGMIIDCEIPKHLRGKYFELCCSQNSYLHDQLIEGLKLPLVVGFIFETINIADAIRSSKFEACEDLKIWDKTLKSFEDMGMKVGFLRARINKLVSLSHDSEEALKCKRLEKEKVKDVSKALERKLIHAKETIERLDYEIEAMEMKGERLEVVFMEEAKAPW